MCDSELRTYKIPEENLPYVQTKLEKLNKKATKLGCPNIKLTIEDTEIETNRVSRESRKFFICSVQGETPKFAGWKFIAKLDHDYSFPIVSTAPNETLPTEYQDHDNSCDHCKTKRYRRLTYVVQNEETHEYKHIGRSCLKDFLGHRDPKMVMSWFTWFDSFMTEVRKPNDGYSYIPRYDINEILANTAMVIECKGSYVSNSKARYDEDLDPTSHHVCNFMFNPKCRDDFVEVNDEHIEIAKKAVEHFETLENDSGYINNCQIILKDKFIKDKEIGLAVSIVGIYINYLEREKIKEVQNQNSLNEYFGEIKKRLDYELTVLSISSYGTDYGISYRVALVDNDGRSFVWFASNNILEEGKTYILKMTIKDHSEFNHIKQTVISRCKIVKLVE